MSLPETEETDMPEKFTPEWCELAQGCWWEGSGLRTADELNALVILEAVAVGFDPGQDIVQIAEDTETWREDPEESQYLSEVALDAQSFLNDLLPEGWSFVFDDGFYLWRIDEDDSSW